MLYFYVSIIVVLIIFVYALIKTSSMYDDYDDVDIYYIEKCQNPDGITIKPDGVHELDPCFYEEIETHYNCTVHVLRCKNCGHIELEWEKQEEWVDEEDENGRRNSNK